MSAQQTRMLDDPHRFLWIATGTKTGKTVSEAQYLIEGIAKGERCAWIGPYYKRTRTGFDHIAGAFSEAARAGLAVIRENKMQISLPASGGVLECFSGDAPDSIYGERFDRVAVDEATRMHSSVLPAVISVVTATNGKVRFAFNLDRGRRHWAVQGFLNARAGGDPDHGYVFMTTAESPYVSAESIDAARRVLPDAVFRALYLGEIQEDGAGVFRNVESLHAGVLEEPRAGASYVMGVDLARTHDWTVLTVIDLLARRVVAWERFHDLPWNVQCDRVAALATKYNGARVVADATGVGDPVVEQLVRLNLSVESFVFTGPSKRDLVEHGIVAVEQRQVTFPAALEVLTNELEAFEYESRPSGQIAYSAPDGMHDDAVVSFLLALWGARRGTGPAAQVVHRDPRVARRVF